MSVIHLNNKDTIVAQATPAGIGAIHLLRMSGNLSFHVLNQIIKKESNQWNSHTVHLCQIFEMDKHIDESLVSVFKGPNTYTGEDVVEISCHGSEYVLNKIMQLCIEHGARLAEPGEFTLRAFLNNKIDLSQAEAVSDLINSENQSSHQAAISQLKGGISDLIKQLKKDILQFTSLVELELDFGEEDVEFANRNQLKNTLLTIVEQIQSLLISFNSGNAVKKGIPVAIVGRPNAGKSSLLNYLLKDDRAIVSTIAGTTRDTIEEKFNINGITFRLIDTAGIRETEDEIEKIGVEKTLTKINEAQIVLYVFDVLEINEEQVLSDLENIPSDKKVIVVGNKMDVANVQYDKIKPVLISAKFGNNINELEHELCLDYETVLANSNSIIINQRHFQSLSNSLTYLNQAIQGIDSQIHTDLLAEDLKMAIYYLSEITGEITNDEILANIFSQFCIGK
ncbi:tRNA uridine-5-carboxymethylaminomethyl(34) synthesis GTPase MnmE [Flavobacterium filum]|uniref:tRNA uridine-5-carboxymethylaminomethyl(34) synthesis GTPase MnmE n=1 Tax=Flavobacterium filum TaxID=370974 RepID=UPI0023F58477|nr:tRNA uridine-5-carboxymethylaminomethyl(34) synthesis GTPase MnmE [Flavobacterium filum]